MNDSAVRADPNPGGLPLEVSTLAHAAIPHDLDRRVTRKRTRQQFVRGEVPSSNDDQPEI